MTESDPKAASDIELQQNRGMIAQSTSRLRLGPVKTETAQIKLIDKDID